jgi:hypothetical protein
MPIKVVNLPFSNLESETYLKFDTKFQSMVSLKGIYLKRKKCFQNKSIVSYVWLLDFQSLTRNLFISLILEVEDRKEMVERMLEGEPEDVEFSVRWELIHCLTLGKSLFFF